MTDRSIGSILLWPVVLAACLCFCCWRLFSDPTALDTNLFAILPATTSSALQQEALARSRSAFARQVTILVSHEDTDAATRGALAVQKQLLQAGLINNSNLMTGDGILGIYNSAPFKLLTSEDRRALENNPVAHFQSSVRNRLNSPFQATITSLNTDPGGYLSRFIMSLPQPYPGFYPMGNGLLAAREHGIEYRMLTLQLPGSGFSQEIQETVANGMKHARDALDKACANCVLRATGPVFFAISSRTKAQHEISLLGMAGTLSLIVMLLFIFHSIRPLLYTLISVGAGVVGALTTVLLVNGSIHILTLVFGTTLLGIGVDYAFHYLVTHWQHGSKSSDILPLIIPGLTLGLITSLIAFSFLFFSGFPALHQIALFSCAGLTTAYLTVILGFPVWIRKEATPIAPRKAHYLSLPARWRPSGTVRFIILLLAIGIMAVGLPQLTADDDVRNLQPLSPIQLAENSAINKITNQQAQPGFFLIQGDTYQQALQREERLRQVLSDNSPGTELLSLSRFIPSIAQQQNAQKVWKTLLSDNGHGWDILQNFGFSEQALATLDKAWEQRESHFITTETIDQNLGFFLLGSKQEPALMALIQGDASKQILYSTAQTVPGASYFNSLDAIERSFEQSRIRAAWLVAGAYFVVLLVLIWRYGFANGIKTLSPPILALGTTLGLIGLFSEPVNIFSVMALIMVLGIGLDYILFLREGADHLQSSGVAVTLAALTSLLSFIYLSFSSIPALHTFGITVSLGMFLMYLSAPLALPAQSNGERA